MHPTLYYGEIATKIMDHFYQYPDRILQLDRTMSLADDNDNFIITIISQASHIFATVQDLFEQENLNWIKTVELYAESILDSLLIGHTPRTVDFLMMIVQSIEALS